MRAPIDVHPDIRRARGLPPEVYRSGEIFEVLRRGVFPRTWQLATTADGARDPGHATPWTLLEGSVDEPLLVVRDREGRARVLSNVCTHRGALIADRPGPVRALRCPYHGRRFELDGRFRSMPGFEGLPDFPSKEDDLAEVPSAAWGPLVFAALEPACSFDVWIEPARRRFGWLPLDDWRLDPASSRDYEVAASWVAYCDNYLEGFHVPYVHASLAPTIDLRAYRTETFEHAVLQVAIAAEGEPAFDLPPSHEDHGQRVAGYYLFLFPNTMLNVYPWGLSVNQVLPRGPERTTVRYLAYVGNESLRARGAGAGLDRIEMEDEAVVESVQRGLRSRFYRRARYAPGHEAGVHHFHRLLARAINEAAGA